MKYFLSLALVLLLSATASAEVTRWVDSQGRVHYSDGPPPPGAKNSRSVSTPAAPAAPAAKTWQEKSMEHKQQQKTQAEAAEKKEKEDTEAKQRQQNCTAARNRLAALESGQRMATYTEKGERVIMDDPAREQAIAEARNAVNSWCK